MASSVVFNIISVSDQNDSTGEKLLLTIQPLPTMVNGTSVPSPYSMQYVIVSPTASQKSTYIYGAQITLTSNV